jgi:hypothetical protein
VFTSFKLPKPRIPGQTDRKNSEPIDLKVFGYARH